MSIENCPLTQIPTEIVSGGPSLVIQVNDSFLKFSSIIFFLVSEAPGSLQNDVVERYELPDSPLTSH